MEKAYDIFEWEFVRAILSKLVFHSKWIEWVMECISMVSYSLLMNGNSEGKIQSSRGIRQRDPLSPYIFILCVKFLDRELVKQSEKPRNHIGIQTHRNGSKITFLMFANYYIIFFQSYA